MHIPEPLKHCFARTLRIKACTGKSGSAFIMDHRKSQWIVTAKHIVDNLGHHDIQVHDQTGQELPGLGSRLPTMANDHETVAIFRFSTEHPDFEDPLEPYVADNLFATQDAYLLGFPDLGVGLAALHPTTPIVKKAIISGQAADKDDNVVWLLDGMATAGFSGGPLITQQESGGYGVFAVVSSYVPKPEDEDKESPPQDENARAEDATQEASGFVRGNSGLVIGYDIQLAVNAINQSLGGSPPE